ncbi:MAG: glycosyltransferase [Flavobacterium sp.]
MQKTYTSRAKILILTSTGGGGHIAVSNAIAEQLKDSYDIETANVFKDLLRPLDPFSYLTFNRYSGEEVYNSFMPNKSFKILSFLYYVGAWFIQLQRKNIEALLHDYFVQSRPSLIISVIPLINNIILDTAQKLNIPFILVPTDLNISMYIRYIKNPQYKNFKLCLPFDDQKIMAPIKETHISQDQIAIVGAPLNTSFFEKKNKSFLKEKLNIPCDKPIIMLLMGAQGLEAIEKYTAKLITLEQPVHLIVCIGKNETSREVIKKLTLPPHITLTIVGFTPLIADYMAVSDLLISKSGTLSVCEALYMNLPLLLDATDTILPWEKFNHSFIKEHNFGDSITSYSMVIPLVSSLLENNTTLLQYKTNLENFKKIKNRREMKRLVKQMLQ